MLKKIIKCAIVILLCLINFLPTNTMSKTSTQGLVGDIPFYKKIIEFFLPSKSNKEPIKSSGQFVYVSGYPIGFSIDGAGAVIVEKSAVITSDGYKNPSEGKDIIIGDVIKEINEEPVTSGEFISEIVNRTENLNKPVKLKLLRNNNEINVEILAEFDIFAQSYRLGLWVRDNAVGVGMVTYVKEDGSFGSLGHPITDIDTGSVLPVMGGRVYKCSIIGAKKGEKGNPGELKGLFLKSANTVGSVTNNKNTGVYGVFDENLKQNFMKEKLEVALPGEVKMGQATLISTVDGINPKHYEIEIIKTSHVSASGEKCMVIRITDPELIKITGGIVQGMSGSPIVQNGKIIGCVTHVFISDPEKGFASYITTMLEN